MIVQNNEQEQQYHFLNILSLKFIIKLFKFMSKNSILKPLLKKAFAVDENVYEGIYTFELEFFSLNT